MTVVAVAVMEWGKSAFITNLGRIREAVAAFRLRDDRDIFGD